MRALFSLLDAGIGGGQQIAIWIAEALVTRGDQVGLVVPTPGPTAGRFEALGASVHYGDLHRIREPRDVPKIARILHGYDILHSHTAIGGQVLGDTAARLARRPHLIHQHTFPQFSTTRFDADLQRRLCRVLLSRRPFIAVAPHVRRGLIDCGIRPENITVIPNGVPLPELALPRNNSPIRFGMLGRFDPGKGMLTFIEAAKSTGLSPGEARFVIGGTSGPFRDHEEEVRLLAAQSGVEIAEPGASGIEFLRGLDVVVMPSRYEGSPLALLEAMSLGKAVIGTDIPGIRSVVGTESLILLVPVDDSEALRAAFLQLAGDSQLRGRAGMAARHLVERGYTKERMVHDALSALDAAVSVR